MKREASPFVRAAFEECWPRWQQHFSPELRLRLGSVRLSRLASLADSPAFPRPDALSRQLSAEELAQWRGLRREERRTEWLGGRLAAKWAGAGLLGKAAEWRTLVIRTEKDGRPYLQTEAGAPFISISHSGPLATALAANLPCGLDIQAPGPRIHRVRKRFVSPAEEGFLNDSGSGSFSETERLTMLWAAKEAVRKLVRASPLLGLLEIRLLPGQEGRGAPAEPLALRFSSGRGPEVCPALISVLCFFADNLAWAMACPLIITKE